jgi:hypothetical protein
MDLPDAVRETVREHVEAFEVPPVPWAALERRYRRGTMRIYGLATLSVTLVAAVGLATVGPARDAWTRMSPPVGSPRYLQDHSLGRLANDPTWSAQMLRQARLSPLDTPQQVLFADDIDAVRVSLVRTRIGNEAMVCWFSGPAGAAPAAMAVEECDSADRMYRVVVGPSQADPRHATVVAVAASGARMSAWTNNDVGRDGRIVSGAVAGREIMPGVYAARLPVPFPQVDLRLDGLPGGDQRAPAYGSIPNPPRLTDPQWWAPAVRGARGDATATPPPALAVQSTYDVLGLRSDIPGARVLWVRRGAFNDTHSLLALPAPSGGWAIVATDSHPRADGSYGSDIEAVALRPAGDPDRFAISWRLTRPTASGRPRPTDELGMVGPRNAVTARITRVGGDPITLSLNEGAGVVGVADPETVTFVNAASQVIASTRVAEPWNWDDGILSHQV